MMAIIIMIKSKTIDRNQRSRRACWSFQSWTPLSRWPWRRPFLRRLDRTQRASHRATRSWPYRRRTEIRWFRVRHSPWRGFRGRCASSRSSHRRILSRRLIRLRFRFRRWSLPPGTWIRGSHGGRTSPCSVVACRTCRCLSRRCRGRGSSRRFGGWHRRRAPSRSCRPADRRRSCRRTLWGLAFLIGWVERKKQTKHGFLIWWFVGEFVRVLGQLNRGWSGGGVTKSESGPLRWDTWRDRGAGWK